MIARHEAADRHHESIKRREIWRTFHPMDHTSQPGHGFGGLDVLNEGFLAPGSGFEGHPHADAEIITYVREGALTFEDSMGRWGLIHSGEFRRLSAGRGIRQTERNASRTDGAHVFQISVRPWEAGLEPSEEQRRFSVAERRGVLCLDVSPDGRGRSIRIHQDVLIYSAILDPGQHVVHELAQGRRSWLHVVQGQLGLGEVALMTGDGAGLTDERALSMTAQAPTEILLFDLARSPRMPPVNRCGL
jgi:redox-sensitive bicupin YhaK (pirin superfamily)